ncbi:MAG: general secretion pathway protein GspK [Puniceicoccales bacterium]|jgi:type II secretory pathway component PulK|nr:general secretion pathway protein GspK [Puniceicoccales bacterium]
MPRGIKTVKQTRRRRAAALLLVLLTLAVLAFIVTEIISAASGRLEWETQRTESDVLRREAFSALEATLGVLGAFQRLDGALYGPAQGWGTPLKLAAFEAGDGVTVAVTLRDESGYYGISAMDTFELRRYFEDLGFAETQAQSMADCLADWTDTGDTPRANGAERESYTDGVAPPNRPLQSLDELRHVQGFAEAFFNEDGTGNESWSKLTGSVSLLSGSALPNINTAPEAVLDVLATRHSFDAPGLLAARSGSGSINGQTTVYRSASDLGRSGIPVSLGSSVSFSCSRLRVIVRATRGPASLVVDTLLDTAGGGSSATVANPGGRRGNAAAVAQNQYPFAILRQRVNARLQD